MRGAGAITEMPPPARSILAAWLAAATTEGSSMAMGASRSWPLMRKLTHTPRGKPMTPTAFSTI